MPTLAVRLLERPNVEYLKAQIESSSPSRAKSALQTLCKLYRRGYRIPREQLHALEVAVVGALYTNADEKVRRWALNAIARIGRREHCLEGTTVALQRSNDSPEIAAAAVAAIHKLSNGEAASIIKGFDLLSPQTISLAALQHVDASEVDMSALPLRVDSATVDDLKLGLILVGIDRAPPNLFHPRHDNGQLVKALGTHDDRVVSQYTVWAITENRRLGLADLGVDLRSIESQESNVKAWMFQLVAMTPESAAKHFDLIQLGMADRKPEVRAGLAVGLRETFVDALEPLMLDWANDEPDNDTHQLVLDHLVRQSGRSPSYREYVFQVYEAESPESETRRRIAANAAGTPLYRDLRRIDFNGQNDLFRGATNVTNINIQNLQGAAVAVGSGNAQNSGSSSNVYDGRTITSIQTELSKAERELHALEIDEALKKEALDDVKKAQTDPAPSNLHKVVATIHRIGKVAGVTGALIEIGGLIAKLAGLS